MMWDCNWGAGHTMNRNNSTVNICSLLIYLAAYHQYFQFFIHLLERDSMVDPLRIWSCAKQILLSDVNFHILRTVTPQLLQRTLEHLQKTQPKSLLPYIWLFSFDSYPNNLFRPLTGAHNRHCCQA